MPTRFLVIACGEKTCASAPDKFCQFVRVTHFGTRWSCHLYEERLYAKDDHDIPNDSGWLQRCARCRADFHT